MKFWEPSYHDGECKQQSSIAPAIVLSSDQRQATEGEEDGAEERGEPVHGPGGMRCQWCQNPMYNAGGSSGVRQVR